MDQEMIREQYHQLAHATTELTSIAYLLYEVSFKDKSAQAALPEVKQRISDAIERVRSIELRLILDGY